MPEIWLYLADHASVDRADRVVEELYAAMQRAADMPGIGHEREDLGDRTLRVVVVHSYLVIYSDATTPIQIVRIIHGARDVRAAFESEL